MVSTVQQQSALNADQSLYIIVFSLKTTQVSRLGPSCLDSKNEAEREMCILARPEAQLSSDATPKCKRKQRPFPSASTHMDVHKDELFNPHAKLFFACWVLEMSERPISQHVRDFLGKPVPVGSITEEFNVIGTPSVSLSTPDNRTSWSAW